MWINTKWHFLCVCIYIYIYIHKYVWSYGQTRVNVPKRSSPSRQLHLGWQQDASCLWDLPWSVPWAVGWENQRPQKSLYVVPSYICWVQNLMCLNYISPIAKKGLGASFALLLLISSISGSSFYLPSLLLLLMWLHVVPNWVGRFSIFS